MFFLKKFAEESASLPQIQVASVPAQEKHTLPGMVPPIAYTKVNAGSPPTPDAGGSSQKSMPPQGAQMLPKTAQSLREEPNMTMKSRPLIQDLVKEAMSSSTARMIASEGARLNGLESSVKEASAGDEEVSTEYALKLAEAIDFVTPQLMKVADGNPPGPPPGVMQTTSSGSPPGPGELGSGKAQPPSNPGVQKAMPTETSPSQMENTIDKAPGGSGGQTTAMSAGKGKSASILAKLANGDMAEAKMKKEEAKKDEEKTKEECMDGKKASAPTTLVDSFLQATKVAEDAINPAKISGGAAVPPEASASGESGGAPVGGMPEGPRHLVHSNESAKSYTKGQAYENRRRELKAYFNEPAMSSSTDKVLQQSFDATSKAGVKIASETVKTAAARAVLTKLAEREAKNTKTNSSSEG